MEPEIKMSPLTVALRLALAGLLVGSPLAALAEPPAASSYVTDPQQSYVQDETGEAIGTVNMIMCLMSSMRPDLMVNQGDYAAMIDKKRCDSKSSDENGGDAPNYMRAVVNSTRDTESDPMLARVWLENREDDGTEMLISVRTQLSQGPSAGLPYGEFRVDYGAPMPGQSEALMQGFLQANANGVSFVESGRWSGVPEVTQLSLQSDGGDTGRGALRYPIWGTNGSRTITFGYNATHFRRDDGSNDRCFTRSLASAKTSVWRYGLYDDVTGDRLDRNSGFPFRATALDGMVHGYIGYHGLSAPPNALEHLSTGTTIEREAHDGSSQTYTLVRNGGKLMRHVLRNRPLAQADGLQFETWADPQWPGLPQQVAGQHVALSWSEQAQAFVIKATMQCDQNGCRFADLQSPVSIAGSAMATAAAYGLSGYSQQLNGQVHIPAAAMTDSSQPFSFRASRLVTPGEIATGTSLYCVSDCPTPTGLGQIASGSASDPFEGSAFKHEPVASGEIVAYQMNADGVLTLAGTPVVFTGAASSLEGTNNMWGIQSGRLVTDMNALECAPSSGQYCAHRADALEVYYTWETGPHPWNGYAGARDGEGQMVVFEAPLRVNWQVPADAVKYGEYAGKSLVLEYSGFGDLHGLPSFCVNPANNAEVPCGTPNARWVPRLTIPFDSSAGVVTVEGGSDQYLVKWLDREVRFAPDVPQACAGITVGDVASLPGTESLVNPSDPDSPVYIGVAPVVTAAPAVIDGQRQD